MSRLTYLFYLAGKSAWNRKGTLILIVFSIALSVTLLLGIERLRTQVKAGFVQSISGTDLVVGARGGDIQLMLYAIFHLGGATNNMGWKSAQEIAALPDVAWTIPISLGDSHRGYPVVATTQDFFNKYRYQGNRELTLAEGSELDTLYDVVLGAEVARKLDYPLGQSLVLSHGSGGNKLTEHSDKPFSVTGILAPTGTPVDRSIYISLAAMEAIHLNWQGGAPVPGMNIKPELAQKFSLEPKNITALLVGLHKRGRVFSVQREINGWKNEALTAVMPGVAMDQLWSMLNSGEKALMLVSALVTVTGLAGLAATILAGLGERRRELAILRSAGASPKDILVLLTLEGSLITISGAVLGTAVLTLLGLVAAPMLADKYGLILEVYQPGSGEIVLLACIFLAGILASLVPAWRAYRMSLSDGLTAST